MHTVTLIPGDGIGPEIAASVEAIFAAATVPIIFDKVEAGLHIYESRGELVPQEVYDSIEKNKVALKGPITTPIGEGFRSINVALRKKYDLYTNIRPVKTIKGITTRYQDVDLVIFRENTEGLYIGEEYFENGNKDSAIALKRITRSGSMRIVRAAFEYAKANNRTKLTVAHKANILKITDGLFLDVARNIAKEYKDITYEEVIIDNMCMQLVINPSQFDVIVTMNLYGDILSDLCAGLIGGLGLAPGANIGEEIAIFEAVHGSAPTIAGKNIANPLALLFSALHMLDYLGEQKIANTIRKAVETVLETTDIKTADLGSSATTTEFTAAIIALI